MSGYSHLKATLPLFTVLMAFTIRAGLAEGASRPSADRLPQPIFGFDFLTSRAGDETFLEVFCEIPAHEFQFVRDGEGFAASYELSITVSDEVSDVVYTKTHVGSEKVRTFHEIDATKAQHLVRFFHTGKPGDYAVDVSIKDLETLKTIDLHRIITLPDYSNPKLMLSDLQIGNKIELTLEDGQLVKNLHPNVRRVVTSDLEAIFVYAELYNLDYTQPGTGHDFLLDYSVVNESGTVVERKESRIAKPGPSGFITLKIKTDKLPTGPYYLHLLVEDLDSHEIARKSASFLVRTGNPS